MYILRKMQYWIFRRTYIINNNCNFNLICRYSLSVNYLYLLQSNGYQMPYLQLFVLLKMGDSDARNM